ncbi:MAG: DNA translocase FtsK 4TM domain-containing protein [Magnetococcus sp. DMHC-6]
MAERKKASSQNQPQEAQRWTVLLREGIGIFILSLMAFVAVSLFTHNVRDPSFNHTGTGEEIQNMAGIVGSYLSDFLLQLFGLSNAWILVLFALMGYHFFCNRPLSTFIDQIVAIPMLLVVSTILSVFFMVPGDTSSLPAGPGGLLGFMGAKAMYRTFGTLGGLLLLVPLGVISLMILTRFSILNLMNGFRNISKGIFGIFGMVLLLEKPTKKIFSSLSRSDGDQTSASYRTTSDERLEPDTQTFTPSFISPEERPTFPKKQIKTTSTPDPIKLAEVPPLPIPPREDELIIPVDPITTDKSHRLEPSIDSQPQMDSPTDFAIDPDEYSSQHPLDNPKMDDHDPDDTLPFPIKIFPGSGQPSNHFDEASEQTKVPSHPRKTGIPSVSVPESPVEQKLGILTPKASQEPLLEKPEEEEKPEEPFVLENNIINLSSNVDSLKKEPKEIIISIEPTISSPRSQPQQPIMISHISSTEFILPEKPISIAIHREDEKNLEFTLPEKKIQPTFSTPGPTFTRIEPNLQLQQPQEPAFFLKPTEETPKPLPVEEPISPTVFQPTFVLPKVIGSSGHTPSGKIPTIKPIILGPLKDTPLTTDEGLPSATKPTFENLNREGDETILPPLSLLESRPLNEQVAEGPSMEQMAIKARILENKLADFKIKGQIIDIQPGPVVTTYELDPAPGVRASKVIGLADDLARNISAVSVRVVGNIPGKNVIGIEIPNEFRQTVYLREILESNAFRHTKSHLAVALGSDITGNPVVGNLAKMPHLLVAGTTGSGKSVAVNAMVCSILFNATPAQVRFLMVDPKMLELSIYEGIPHLLSPVVTDVKKAANMLKWAVSEMEDRYRLMSELGVRNLEGYNQRILECIKNGEQPSRRVRVGFDPETGHPVEEDEPIPLEQKPLVVIIIDELADLMIQVGKDVEPAIARLAQMARAAGLHLIIATQRPSVDVITGLIKANFPTRIAFKVFSKIDSRTILDAMGADQLLGMGDGLYLPPGTSLLQRIHAPFVSDQEVHRLVRYLKSTGTPDYDSLILEEQSSSIEEGGIDGFAASGGSSEYDELYDKAAAVVIRARKVSTSMIQRHFKIGYNRAATIVEKMEKDGLISQPSHTGKREVLAPSREG